MGAGAGYSMRYRIEDIAEASVSSIDVKYPGTTWYGKKQESKDVVDITITGSFKGTVDLTDIYSYMYNAEDLINVPCEITKIYCPSEPLIFEVREKDGGFAIYDAWHGDWADYLGVFTLEEDAFNTAVKETIKYFKNNMTPDDYASWLYDKGTDFNESTFTFGGGYVHSTWDGTFQEIDTDGWHGFIDARITDQKLIDYVDSAVTGDNIDTTWYVTTDTESFDQNEFDDVDEAMEFAQELYADGEPYVVVIQQDWIQNQNGDFEEYDMFVYQEFGEEEDYELPDDYDMFSPV